MKDAFWKQLKIGLLSKKNLKSVVKKNLRSNYAESNSWSNNWLFNLIFCYIFINLLSIYHQILEPKISEVIIQC